MCMYITGFPIGMMMAPENFRLVHGVNLAQIKKSEEREILRLVDEIIVSNSVSSRA